MKKIVISVAILSLIVIAGGCLDISMYTKVAGDGNVSDMRMEINTTSYVYGLIQEGARQHGYETVEEYMLSNLTEAYGNGSAGGNTFDYGEEWYGDGKVKMTLAAKGSFMPGGPFDVYRDGDYMIFEFAPEASPAPTTRPSPTASPYGYDDDSPFLSNLSDAMMSHVTFNYYLEMPGRIVESNATAVDGNKAEWHMSGRGMDGMRMYARSEVPAAAPGFEAILAMAGIVAGYCLVASRKKES